MSATTLYVASRASEPARPAMWRNLRASGWPIISTWIDEAGPGETADMGELWQRIVREVAAATGLVLYVENSDFPLKGAYVEIGVAMACGKRIGVVPHDVLIVDESMRPLGSWAAHPLVKLCRTLDEARAWAESTPGQNVRDAIDAYADLVVGHDQGRVSTEVLEQAEMAMVRSCSLAADQPVLQWSSERPPGEDDCPYHHVVADTPLGKAIIDWKGWKGQPTYDAAIEFNLIASHSSLEDAKQGVAAHLKTVARSLAGWA